MSSSRIQSQHKFRMMIIAAKDALDPAEAGTPRLLCGIATKPVPAPAIDQVDAGHRGSTVQIAKLHSNPGRSVEGNGDRERLELAPAVPPPWASSPFEDFRTNGRYQNGDPLLDIRQTHYPASLACIARDSLTEVTPTKKKTLGKRTKEQGRCQ